MEEGRHDELVAGGGLYSRLYSYSDVGAGSDSASAIAVSTNGAAGFESPSGIWNVKLESPRGTREGVLELVADGSSLSGTWTGERGVQRFAGGTVEGSDLTWEVRVAAPMGELSLSFTGVVTNGILKGDVAFGPFGKGRFEAKRAGAE